MLSPSRPYASPTTLVNTSFVSPRIAWYSSSENCGCHCVAFCREPISITRFSSRMCIELNSSPLTMEKMAVFTPMPSARVTIAIAAKPGFFHSWRRA